MENTKINEDPDLKDSLCSHVSLKNEMYTEYVHVSYHKQKVWGGEWHNPNALTQLLSVLKITSQSTYIYIDFNLEAMRVYTTVEAG